MATGQTLRVLRTLKGIKQTALAKKLGTHLLKWIVFRMVHFDGHGDRG